MSTAKPLRPVARATNYIKQEALRALIVGGPFSRRPFTPAQRRRIRHKNHKMLGAAGKGTVKPKQVKTRQTRPAPAAGGLLRLLSPKQMRQRVAARSARTGIKFNVQGRSASMVIIDDEMQHENGDR